MNRRFTIPFDPRRFRDCLGLFPTGVCVVTAAGGDGPVGMTMNSFNSLSLEPPLVLFSVDRRARSLPAWEAAPAYAVHVLAEDQQALSERFAISHDAKWDGVAWKPGLHGVPLLDDVVARFECVPHARHDGGDHLLFVAEVKSMAAEPGKLPLVYRGGRYGGLRPSGGIAHIWPLDGDAD
ncbi:MAG: flavin reductase family protein [Flavobacteriaceae bacterium]